MLATPFRQNQWITSVYFQQYLSQALEFKNHSHIDGLGLQGHMRANTEPNPTMLKVYIQYELKHTLKYMYMFEFHGNGISFTQ